MKKTQKKFTLKKLLIMLMVTVIAILSLSQSFPAYATVDTTGNFDINITTSMTSETNYSSPIFTIEITNLSDDFDGVCRISMISNLYSEAICAYDTNLSLAPNTTKQFELKLNSEFINSADSFKLQLINSKNEIVSETNLDSYFFLDQFLHVGVLSNNINNYYDFEMNGNTVDTNQYNYYNNNSTYQIKVCEMTPDKLTLKELNKLFVLVIDDFDTSTLSQDELAALSEWTTKGGIVLLGTGSYANKVLSSDLKAALNINCPASKLTVEKDVIYLNGNLYSDIPHINPTVFSNAYPFQMIDGIYSLSDSNYSLCNILISAFSFKDYFSSKNIISYDREIFLKELYINIFSDAYISNTANSSNSITNNMYTLTNLFDQLAGIENSFPSLLVTIILLFYLVLLCPLAYLVLKRCKKQEFFWIYIPAISVITLIVLFILSIPQGKILPQLYSVNLIDTTNAHSPITYAAGYKARIKPWAFKINDNYSDLVPLGKEDDFSLLYNSSNNSYDICLNTSTHVLSVNPNNNNQLAYFYSDCPIIANGDFEIPEENVIKNNTGEVFDYILFNDAYNHLYLYDGKKYPDTLDLKNISSVLSSKDSSYYSQYHNSADGVMDIYYEHPNKYHNIPLEYISTLNTVQELITSNYAYDRMYVIAIKKGGSPVADKDSHEENLTCYYTFLTNN